MACEVGQATLHPQPPTRGPVGHPRSPRNSSWASWASWTVAPPVEDPAGRGGLLGRFSDSRLLVEPTPYAYSPTYCRDREF